MKLGWKKRFLIILGILIGISAIVYLVLILTMDNPPINEFQTCQNVLSKAKRANADVYASDYYHEAERKYKLALIEWKIQNEKIFFTRNYSRTRTLVMAATLKAQEANASSGVNKDSMKMKYLKEIELLNRKLDKYHEVFIHLPLKASVRKNYEFGKLSLEQGLSAFGKGDVMTATKRLNEGKTRIGLADKEVNALVSDYFTSFSKWQRWVSASIHQSAQNNSYALVVDKIKHKMYLYYKGKISREYDIELGRNWLGDKHYAGDNATPEGNYRITRKKGNGDSRYYKALLINYPNEEDYSSFNAKKRAGQISRNSHIGGLIEVHGEGGKGSDWTNGCVALTNKDMDEIFSRISVGTPITIVGSMVSLAELLN